MSLSDFLVTFGKHRGHTIREMQQDHEYYAGWMVRQPWWPDKWEAKVIKAIESGSPIPTQPKIRPMLEQEYDPATEKPTKVRKITHRVCRPFSADFVCPGCGDNLCSVIARRTDGLCVRCVACGQHALIMINFREDCGQIQVHFFAYDCPFWENKTREDYDEASAKCPDHKGFYADHTGCGCWNTFECKCV